MFTDPEAKKFKELFGEKLVKFWHPVFGFDVVKFDDFLHVPDGVSISQHLKNTYGDDAEELVKGFLNRRKKYGV